MTDDKKKHDDNDRKKVSDEEMEDVAGGIQEHCANGTFLKPKRKDKRNPAQARRVNSADEFDNRG